MVARKGNELQKLSTFVSAITVSGVQFILSLCLALFGGFATSVTGLNREVLQLLIQVCDGEPLIGNLILGATNLVVGVEQLPM